MTQRYLIAYTLNVPSFTAAIIEVQWCNGGDCPLPDCIQTAVNQGWYLNNPPVTEGGRYMWMLERIDGP